MQRFLQRNHDVGFDIVPALRHGATLPESAEGRPAATATEECFEKIAESGAAELKFNTTVFPTAPAKSAGLPAAPLRRRDRKSTRLNSSHSQISYAVFCLKKKNTNRLLRLLSQHSNLNITRYPVHSRL